MDLGAPLIQYRVMRSLIHLYRLMSTSRRRQFLVVLFLMLAGATAEMMTIGAALPFLALVSDPNSPILSPRIQRLVGFADDSPLVSATILLVVAAVAGAVIRLSLFWQGQRFIMALGHDIATSIFSRILRQPYEAFIRRNSSEVLAGVEKVQLVVYGILNPAMQGVIASVIGSAIIVLLIVIDPLATIAAAVGIGAIYVAVSTFAGRRLRSNSRVVAGATTIRAKIIQEGLGGIRDILLDRAQPFFESKFAREDANLRRAHALNAFMSAAPRFVIEGAGIVAIALLALTVSFQPGGFVNAIPVLGALALGAQRLLPLLQQVYNGWSQTSGNLQVLDDVIALMATPIAVSSGPTTASPLPLATEIVFDAVSFSYETDREALSALSVRIPHGARVGIWGPTGGGKSTFLDLLMGLLAPTQGEIRIDDRPLDDVSRAAWQGQIAHVPQSIYLADASIAANIAFGLAHSAIDEARVRAAARSACLEDFIAGLPHGFETRVGERGTLLSGGQRQRIGIARALYKAAPVLILDEATSALDDETEAAVIASVMAAGPQLTIIMVAHRQSALAGCNFRMRLVDGRLG